MLKVQLLSAHQDFHSSSIHHAATVVQNMLEAQPGSIPALKEPPSIPDMHLQQSRPGVEGLEQHGVTHSLSLMLPNSNRL